MEDVQRRHTSYVEVTNLATDTICQILSSQNAAMQLLDNYDLPSNSGAGIRTPDTRIMIPLL